MAGMTHTHRRSNLLRLMTLALALAALVTVAACGKKTAPKVDTYKGDAEGFQLLAGDLVAAAVNGDTAHLAAMSKTMKLPDPAAWFGTTFGPEARDRMVAEYNGYDFDKLIAQAPKLFTQLVKTDGRTSVDARRIDSATDERGTGYQVTAIKLMKQPTPLYSMRLELPDGSKTFSLWSFAYVDGAFRIVGKMKTADPTPLSDDLAQLSELPVEDARALLKP